jgi:hypothetical protein
VTGVPEIDHLATTVSEEENRTAEPIKAYLHFPAGPDRSTCGSRPPVAARSDT